MTPEEQEACTVDLPEIVSDLAGWYIRRALKLTDGNKTLAAELLGLNSHQTLTNWMRKHGVS